MEKCSETRTNHQQSHTTSLSRREGYCFLYNGLYTTAANPGTNAFQANTDQNQDAAYNAAGPSTSGYQREGYRGRRGFGGRRRQGPFRGGVNQHAHRKRDAANLETTQQIFKKDIDIDAAHQAG